ncbi:MAG TPA: hypothetical protein VF914_18730 [Chloroflexia bacterium]|jgi:hypothetical protein
MDKLETTDNGSSADVATVLGDLREQIRQRRAHLAINDPNDPHALSLAELRRSVEAVNEVWFVSAHLPITWDVRIFGRLLAYAKRVTRLLLRWYINPIVEQQNRFNSATARAVTVMNAYQERMTREWMLLEERVAKLEEEVRGWEERSGGQGDGL